MQRTSRCEPIQVSQWKRQVLDGASELFTSGKKSKDQNEGQAKEAELFQQIGRLQLELEWLKKNLSCSDALELRKLVDHDHPELSVSRQCALLGLPRSTLCYQPTPMRESTLRIMARIDALYLTARPHQSCRQPHLAQPAGGSADQRGPARHSQRLARQPWPAATASPVMTPPIWSWRCAAACPWPAATRPCRQRLERRAYPCCPAECTHASSECIAPRLRHKPQDLPHI
jgi:hypothetical protein